MHWCQFLSDYKGGKEIKSLYYIKKNKTTSDRYLALNLTNRRTIEFRIFRGTLKFETFMASVELVNNIMTLCSNLEIPIEDITWNRLTETEYAKAYCEERDIHTDKVVVDNSIEEIRREAERERILLTLDKKVIELYNEVMKEYSVDRLLKKNNIDVNRNILHNTYYLINNLQYFVDNIRDMLGAIKDKNMNIIKYWVGRVANNQIASGINLNKNETLMKLMEYFKSINE